MSKHHSSKFNPVETLDCYRDFSRAFNELTFLVSCAEAKDEQYDCYGLLSLLENKLEELGMRIGVDSANESNS